MQSIELAIQCHYFQRRLCWMLSSLLQQRGLPPDCSLTVSVAYMEGAGNPATEAVLAHFAAAGLRVKPFPYPDTSELQYRGLTRNRQLQASAADWIAFADSDCVYPPEFFAEACRLLAGPYAGNPHCLHSARLSTELPPTRALVDGLAYPQSVPDAWGQAKRLPGRLRSNCGAGYFQLANVALLRANHGGVYQRAGRPLDWSWARRQKAKSDMHFRKMLGREAIPLPVQVHLQHERDIDYGRHVEVQR